MKLIKELCDEISLERTKAYEVINARADRLNKLYLVQFEKIETIIENVESLISAFNQSVAERKEVIFELEEIIQQCESFAEQCHAEHSKNEEIYELLLEHEQNNEATIQSLNKKIVDQNEEIKSLYYKLFQLNLDCHGTEQLILNKEIKLPIDEKKQVSQIASQIDLLLDFLSL